MSPRPRTRRQQYEYRQRVISAVIATISTLAVVGVLWIVIPQTPRWPQVRRSFFDGDIFSSEWGRLLWKPFVRDVQMFLWCIPFIVVWALILAMFRNVRAPFLFPLRLFATLYTDIFRGIPVILTIYLVGFGIPGLGFERPWNSPYLWGSFALVLTYSAYVSEVFRAGIESIHESQRAAARSLGLSSGQTMRHVVLPQAVRRVVPPLMNDFVSLQKDVALVSLIGPVEMLRRAGIDKAKFANFTPYVVAALLFLALTIPMTRLTDWLVARERRQMSGTAVR